MMTTKAMGTVQIQGWIYCSVEYVKASAPAAWNLKQNFLAGSLNDIFQVLMVKRMPGQMSCQVKKALQLPFKIA